ncbi:predicted protein [Histoplasma capsulatum G186AR]|uniref:Uncharacterized protein n=1 Tax=Ajellomyces capsulatus (strain G186AR / H82 / ATCC MYA-2454 / RMSCC 2432) TaxID=447093 RepID=C0P0X2_AJECG|nr:uncharacterized protein HCBG_09052 [Histoplasma capsulatum G186AR]EEH02772.1 predicted protein [Histoplasma capsulatum G186AR]
MTKGRSHVPSLAKASVLNHCPFFKITELRYLHPIALEHATIMANSSSLEMKQYLMMIHSQSRYVSRPRDEGLQSSENISEICPVWHFMLQRLGAMQSPGINPTISFSDPR